MSEFDKEAERERLREKFARDEEKRADTQRMSELLLKGATMTNRHCDTCGDPIFRHEGREFCATCQGRAAESQERTPATDASEAVDGEATGAETAGADATAEGERSPAATAEHTEEVDEEATGGAAQSSGPRGGRSPKAADNGRRSAAGRPSAPTGDVAGDLGESRASLKRTLAKHAAAAESADDPRVATDHLDAARAAAETLRALDGR